jgi:serine phosphatase RsbU (regulator of sigma subunit)
VTPTDLVPLHRLLKRQEAAALLAEFEKLLPEGNLALIGADGRVYAGSAAWNRAELQRLYAQAGGGRAIHAGDLVLQPVSVKSQLVGALVARVGGDSSRAPPVERVLRCLHDSLTLLLNRALETREVVTETLDRYREINLLYRIGETIGGCLDADEITHRVLGEVRRIIRADAGAVVLWAEPVTGTNEDGRGIAASFGADEHVRALQRAYRQVIAQAFDTSQATIANLTRFPQPVDVGIGIILCAPMKTQDRTLGALVLGRLVGQPEFTAGDGKLAMALTHQAVISMETARLHQEEVKRQRLEEELAIGHKIQLSLLPQSCPAVPGWEFAAAYRPARHVGGDLYDFIPLPGEPSHLGMVIADVTGKGIPAALFMAFSRTVIRSEAMNGRSPATILQRANRLIVRDIRYRLFLSAFYATLDTRSGRLVYANGGHNWPLWLRAAPGETHWLAVPGFVLGAFQDVELPEQAIDVRPGDILVFYTDGVTEARNPNGDLFGEERLRATVQANADASPQQLQETIVTAVEGFADGTPLSDDLTLFVVKRQR